MGSVEELHYIILTFLKSLYIYYFGIKSSTLQRQARERLTRSVIIKLVKVLLKHSPILDKMLVCLEVHCRQQ